MENKNPKISVIVPVYNVEQYLRRCVDSILAQTFTDFELLLIDDGSKDSSGEICDEYATKDERVRVFHKKNGGVSSARNLGLDKANGEWICFVDSDDTVTHTLLSNFHFGYDIEFQGANIYKGDDENICSIIKYDDENVASDCASTILLKGVNTAPWGKCFRKSIIDEHKVRFPKEISYGEDSVFLFEYLSYCSTSLYNSSIGYNYFVFDYSLGHKRHPIESIIRMYEMQYEWYFRILSDSNRKEEFFHKKTLTAVRELMLWYQIPFKRLNKYPVINQITVSYLHRYERLMLMIPQLFYKYCSFYFKFYR